MSMPNSPEPNIVLVPGRTLPTQKWWKALHSTIITSFQNKDIMAFPPTWTRLPNDPKLGAERLKEELGPDGVIAVVLLVDRPIACAGALPFRGPNWINDVKSAGEEDPTEVEAIDGEAIKQDPACTDSRVASIPDQNALADWDPRTDWEICCFCIHPVHRKIGLSPKVLKALIDHIKNLGAKRLVSNYVIEETGQYWYVGSRNVTTPDTYWYNHRPHMGFETIPGAGGVLRKGYTHTAGMEGLRADIHFAMGVKTI